MSWSFVKRGSHGPLLKEKDNHFVYQDKEAERKENTSPFKEIRIFCLAEKKIPSRLLWNEDHLELLYLLRQEDRWVFHNLLGKNEEEKVIWPSWKNRAWWYYSVPRSIGLSSIEKIYFMEIRQAEKMPWFSIRS